MRNATVIGRYFTQTEAEAAKIAHADEYGFIGIHPKFETKDPALALRARWEVVGHPKDCDCGWCEDRRGNP